MALIEINHLTKDYSHNRGVFDLSLEIPKGEVFGFTGTNGAGKTTTIRHLMGFLKPQRGTVTINGLDAWEKAAEVKKLVGYTPGEIAFPDEPTGMSFLKHQAKLIGLKDLTYAYELIDKLQLDPSANLKRMSKGMKQKTALVATFMADPEILILDEPTTGLDPLMRAEFIDIMLDEKKKGKTIFMSSHMMDELEITSDRVALIENGRLQKIAKIDEIKHSPTKFYKLEFLTKNDYLKFVEGPFLIKEKRPEQQQVIVEIHDSEINLFTKHMTQYQVKFMKEIKHTLEDFFKGNI